MAEEPAKKVNSIYGKKLLSQIFMDSFFQAWQLKFSPLSPGESSWSKEISYDWLKNDLFPFYNQVVHTFMLRFFYVGCKNNYSF